jgi:hypothetical protein
MESLVSNHAIALHGEQTVAARGEYFNAECSRREDWPTIAFVRRSDDLALGLQHGPQHLGLFSGLVSGRM